jgi:hypothetical protein
MSPEHVELDELEDLARVGTLGDREPHVRAHLASCASCGEAYDQFVSEYTLFARRASSSELAPFLVPDVLDVAELAAEVPRSMAARAAPAVVGIAACAAMLAGFSSRESVRPLSETVTGADSVAQASFFGEEPTACALPVSGLVSIGRSTASESQLRARGQPSGVRFGVVEEVCAVADRGLCEERMASSIATR